MIRAITIDDIDRLKSIHEQFFAKEFSFDDFVSGSISNFLISDDNDNELVTACSVRPIAEMVAITNMNKSPRLRRNALLDALQIAHYVLRDSTMSQLHVFVQDAKWEEMLKRSGFQSCVGRPLYINLRGM